MQMPEKYKNTFTSHIATLEDRGDLQILTWAEPGTIACSIKYLCQDSTLFVTGDFGCATFRWFSSGFKIQDIRGMSLGYVYDKCWASEVGREFLEFNTDLACADLDTLYHEHLEEIEEGLSSEEFNKFREDHDSDLDTFKFNTETKEQWVGYLLGLGRYDPDPNEVFGNTDALYSVGTQYAERFKLIYYGLQMALEQLDEREKNQHCLERNCRSKT